MPNSADSLIASRGGAIRWRSVRLKDGRHALVAITRDPGPHGGRVVLVKIRNHNKE